MGLDLHRITLGALIIALGLLVDDAIIAVEMMVVKIEQGFDRIRAASFAWESTARRPLFFPSALPIPQWVNMPAAFSGWLPLRTDNATTMLVAPAS
jgi:hypothetical protein